MSNDKTTAELAAVAFIVENKRLEAECAALRARVEELERRAEGYRNEWGTALLACEAHRARIKALEIIETEARAAMQLLDSSGLVFFGRLDALRDALISAGWCPVDIAPEYYVVRAGKGEP